MIRLPVLFMLSVLSLCASADPDSLNRQLREACQTGNLGIVKECLQKGADPNSRPMNSDTPLQLAVASDCMDCVSWLLKNGADLRLNGAFGKPLGHYAASPAMADHLLSWGVTFKGVDAAGENALMAAVRLKKIEVARYFLEKRLCKQYAKNKSGWSVLAILMMSGPDNICEWLDMLVSKGANMNALDDKGWTPLMHAVRWRRLEAVKCLVQKGANTTFRDKTGKSALDLAREYERTLGGTRNVREIAAFLGGVGDKFRK